MRENNWEKIDVCELNPEPRSGHSSCILNEKYYIIFGGYGEKDALNDMYKFDINMKKWSKVLYSNKDVEIPPKRASSVLINFDSLNCLYLFGGTGHNPQNLLKNDLYEFNFSTSYWSTIKTIGNNPSERYGHSMTLYKNNIVLFGGVKINKNNNPEYLNDLYIYSIFEKNWFFITYNGAIPQPRHGHQTLILDNCLYIIGGTNSSVRFGNIHKIDLNDQSSSIINFEYSKKKENLLFKGRYGHSVILDEKDIYIFGGKDDEVCSDILSLNLREKTWRRKKCKGDKCDQREFFSSSYFNRQLIIFGGRKGEKKFNDLYIWYINIPKPSHKDCSLSNDMMEMYMKSNDKNLSDLIIITNNEKEYYCHKNIIKARCKYLFEMIISENGRDIIYFNHDDSILNYIIKYIYSGEINIFDLDFNKSLELLKVICFSDLDIMFSHLLFYTKNSIKEEVKYQNLYSELSILKSQLEFHSKKYVEKNKKVIEKTMESINNRQTTIKKQNIKEKEEKIKNRFNHIEMFENLNEKHYIKYYSDFENLYLDTSSSNFEIIYKEKTIKVHKNILLARSKYFESIFLHDSLEKDKNFININEKLTSLQILDCLIKFIYMGLHQTKKMTLNLDDSLNLLEICSYFEIKCPNFSFLIEDKISEFLTEKNCIEILDISDRINAPILKQKSLAFISENFSNIIKLNEELLKILPNNILIEIMVNFSKRHS